CLLSLFFLSFSFIHAQNGLLSDKGYRYSVKKADKASRAVSEEATDTLSISASDPFFDDFSASTSFPLGSKWVRDTLLNFPNVMKASFLTAPTKGVATFDGLNAVGRPYEDDELVSGEADRLVSQAIDLSSFSPASNVVLTFYLFSGGLTESPESADSFRVSFRADDGNFYEQLRVSGGQLLEFQQFVVPVDESRFFYPGFQLKFQSIGALTGFQDTWHLDYVLLGPNRTNVSPVTMYDDASIVRLMEPTLAPYTAIPLAIYGQENIDFVAGVPLIRNLSSQSKNLTLTANLSEADDKLNFSGTTMLSTVTSALANNQREVPFPQAFSNQNLSTPVTAQIDYSIDANDRVGENDVLTEIVPLDSVWALDDGEADAAFGLTESRGFGMEFDFSQPQTLTALWINFVPFLNVNQQTGAVTPMEGRAFRITVWKDPHPDSTIVRQLQGNLIQYGDSLNQFIRYPLSPAVELSGKVWIGIQQVENLAVGIGVDRSYNNRTRIFRDSVSNWVNVGFTGTLMMRPEIGGGNPITSVEDGLEKVSQWKLYPNPLRTNQLSIQIPASLPNRYGAARLEIFNLTGQQLASISFRLEKEDQQLTLPDHLPDGLLLYRINLEDSPSIQNNYGTLVLQRKQ
ncbi:MAG: T9SS type A sorting domain-containing protein, partial [Bacteroidota bacterium]